MKKKKVRNERKVLILLLAGLTMIAACGIWYVWKTGIKAEIKLDKERYPVVGIDLSSHNGKIDFNKLRSDSVRFVYLKATEGATFKDSAFERNYKAAVDVEGLAVGAYHFFRFDVNGILQAKNFTAALSGKKMQMPPVIDVEEHGNPDIATDVIVTRLQEMISALETSGIQPIIYTNMDGYRRIYRDNFQDYPLWISRFESPSEDVEWTIWQYSHWGEVDGVAGEVDLNVFGGTYEDFLLWIAQ